MPDPAPKPAGGAATGVWQDPYRNYHFKLDIQGITEAHFTECSSIGVRVQAITYREAGDQPNVRRIPGRVEYADVTLRYGLTKSTDLWKWLMNVASGTADRKNVSVILMDSTGMQEVTRWNLNNAWPREWSGAPLDARGQEIAIESLTLVFESVDRDGVGLSQGKK